MQLARKLDGFGNAAYEGTWLEDSKGRSVWSGRLNRGSLATLNKPRSIRRPSIIFVNSMSDFFHADAPDEWRIDALKVMYETPRHQYQVLTKRPELVRPFMDRVEMGWFPDNVWIGATVESRLVLNRIDMVRKVPAPIRFLSIEPLLSDLGDELDLKGIDWIITGGESGPGARPMRFEWLERVWLAARRDGVRHFFKQYGVGSNNPLWDGSAAALAKVDPIGKGGSKIFGEYVKEMPGEYGQLLTMGT